MPTHSSQLVGIAARCVLLAPPGSSPDPELLEALNRPDLALVQTDNIFIALAELCAAARRDVETLRAGGRGDGLILLLSHPGRLNDPASLVHAAERYAPHASVWLFDPAGTPRLRAVRVDDVTAWMQAAEAKAAKAVAAASAISIPKISPGRDELRQLSGPRPERTSPYSREIGKDRQDSEILSTEELAMLLAVDPPGVHNEHDRST